MIIAKLQFKKKALNNGLSIYIRRHTSKNSNSKMERIGHLFFGMATIWIIPDSVQPIKCQTLVLLLLRILFDRTCMSSIK